MLEQLGLYILLNKKRFMRKLALLFLLLAIAGCTREIEVRFGNEAVIFAEVADEQDEWERGLMFRNTLDDDTGMIFIFDKEDYYSFWMKNTRIPLDMIWISEDKKVVDIKEAEPCIDDPCTSYKPAGKAKYVLEVNQGFAENNSIKIGDKVSF